MKFKQIVLLDNVRLLEDTLHELNTYSENPIKVFDTDPKDHSEIRDRISEGDCVLLTWRTPLTKEILDSANNIKFICVCGTNSSLIDLEECSKKGIAVSNVRDYGDEGVVEWAFFQLIGLLRGFGKYQWKEEPLELSGKTIGIIGLGAVGKLLADIALGFKMKVLYTSIKRKPEFEKKGLLFADKKELVKQSDIITLQTPKNVKVLEKEDFDLMQGKILVNNTLGRAFDKKDFDEWIKKENNYAIMDMVSDFHDEFKEYDRVLYSNIISGKTHEWSIRLSQKVIANIKAYLSNNPINKIN